MLFEGSKGNLNILKPLIRLDIIHSHRDINEMNVNGGVNQLISFFYEQDL